MQVGGHGKVLEVFGRFGGRCGGRCQVKVPEGFGGFREVSVQMPGRGSGGFRQVRGSWCRCEVMVWEGSRSFWGSCHGKGSGAFSGSSGAD